MPTAPADQRDAHLAMAARVKAHRLLELASRLAAGTASDTERAEVQWEVMGKELEPAEAVPVAHLAAMLSEHVWREVEVLPDDPAWQPPGRVVNAHYVEPQESPGRRLVIAADAALDVQRECALLDIARSLAECSEVVADVRKSSRGQIAWAAAARLYLGSNADSATLRAAANSAEKWWGRASGKYQDAREDRPERRKA